VTAILDQFTPTAKGLVPAALGNPGATYYLNAAGGWTQPAGGGGTTTNALTIGSGLSGTSATFNGSAAVTISLNVGNANTWTALQTFKNNIYLGESGGLAGSARFIGSSSGYVILQAPSSPSNQTYTLPSAYPGSNGYALVSTTGGTLSWSSVGTGDVTGPSSSTANGIVVFNGLTGKIIKDSGVTFPIGVSNGGIGITSGTSGGILFFDSTTSLGSTLTLASNSLVIGGGAGIAPSTITTGTGVLTALGVNVGTAGSFVVNGGALGTPLSGNFTTGTFSWPTFNQNTTGSAASLTTARNIQTNLGSTSAASFNGTADITPGVSGTLLVGNGGTGITSATAYAVICGGTTSTGAFQSVSGVGTAGQVLTSNGAGALPTWQTGGGGGSGTVNSGTQYQLAYYATTGTAVSGLTTGTNGQVLTLNASLIPTWTTLSTSTTLTNIGAATATATLNNANSIITWNWNSNTTQNAFVIASSSLSTGHLLNLTNTSTANTASRALNIAVSGATNNGATFGAYISNTKTGTTSTNTALYLTSSGGTTNYAFDVAAGISRFAAGTGATPQIILTPSSSAGGTTFTGTVDGSLWYDTNTTTNNSSLTLYKLYGSATALYTKVITKDYNPDFATGSASGVVVSDSSGTLSKSADLTALGVYAQTNTLTAITTGSGSLIGTVVGSTTLSTNFFGAGKTLEFLLAGLISTAGSGSPSVAIDFKITDGTTTITLGTLTYDTSNLTSRVYMLDAEVTCRTSGSNPTFGVCGQMIVNHTSKNQETVFITPGSVTATGLNTSSALTLQITATWTNPGATSSIDTRVNYCQYIN
jgi:hypothetical protein